MRKLFMALLGALTFATASFADDAKSCGTPVALNDGWTLATPEAAGLDTARLCDLDKFISRWPLANVHAVLVIRGGKLVLERYYEGADDRWGTPVAHMKFAPDVKHDLRSISKSVTSLLVGIALGEGKFPALDSAVLDQFPEHAALRTAENASLTFRHLLTMSSGMKWDESMPYSNPANSERQLIASSDPARYVLEQPFVAPPGSVYNYNGGNTSLLASMLTKTTGRPIEDYAREKLFTPLDIADFEWVKMPANGVTAAASGLRLRPRDMAKLGQLMLTDGQWNGRQVLPKGWAADSMAARLSGEGIYYYGYQWWLGRSMLRGREHLWAAGFGYGGQRLYVVPALDLVVAINAGHYGNFLQSVIPHGIFTRVVLPSIK